MTVYILDSLYRRVQLLDRYELVWTERYSAFGDCILTVDSTIDNRSRFVEGARLAIPESSRVMTIETVEDTLDEERKRILRCTGYSLERVLEHRLARDGLSDLTTDPKWIIEDFPVAIAEKIFHDICVTGVVDTGDIIPGVIEGDGIFPPDTIAEPSEEVVYEIDMMSVYKAIKDIADIYDFGFRLVRNGDTSELYWDVYTGSDRTTQQTTLAAVVFSPDLDDLRDTTEIKTTALYKNVAYVVSPVGAEIVYALDIDPLIEGFERRALFVKADDIDDVVPADATARMIQRGQEELAKSRKLTAIDGELAPNSPYIYGTHYNLGDLVELRTDDGNTAVMRVTEQIFVRDKEGNRSYPTLSIRSVVSEGEWDSMGPTVEWDDMTTEEWDTMPG